MRAKIETKKYLFAFIITALVFFGALVVSNKFSAQRIAEIKAIENNISMDILASETQFALLKDSSCKAIDHSTAFSEELSSLTAKLSYMEDNLGANNLEVISLKKYYSLLQVKDYLLVKQVKEKCGVKPITIIYFYSNAGDCEGCVREGYVLTKLRTEFPELRIYSFDYNLDLSVVKTMKSIYGVRNTLPALNIWEENYYGFKSAEDIEKIIPQLKKLRIEREKAEAAKAATSTKN
ncbi:MAG: hypothetical protein A2747_01565 [Candidatus Yonathbacteria bacterium RIFCSPHIGHO2_01_FULL_44_41]|uniref:Thioredoxin domain-containing protein n=1 Tax=Candidatus Yonathbacteria bacterium RIFCSPHIGHO2_02_FULL_44_14 TaxID=1802724 RepID=A0A1G2S8U6_9BACT|nr:MAG: hypothetical protein A2747_01565 [Candidatus Yonathbacteria bacterium RIFCSPHIGHO2_01_FULL_44_41]OHA80992.1 MAG: hypothetical protein A3D51_03145 [Candidatus Yonathbacteria bacterium RIFCSPHIGHO2_02_FULL_44_14]OHA82425.1 MAG: hypothetical protein A3B06_00785 [Candidatus Yonathbacteria bacterium RIFCSPLOWO2_01_FULL_43_20]